LKQSVELVGFETGAAGTGSDFSSPSRSGLFLRQTLTRLMKLSLPLSCLLWSGWPLELGGSCMKVAHTELCYLEMLQFHVPAQMVMLDREMLQVAFNDFTT
jgi:hypothetical protein